MTTIGTRANGAMGSVRLAAAARPVTWESDWFSIVPLALFAIFGALLFTGYRLETTCLPQILHALDPQLCAADYRVQAMSGQFNVRWVLVRMICGLCALGFTVPLAFAFTYLVALGGTVCGAFALGRLVGASRLCGLVLAGLALAPLRITLGMTTPFTPVPIPQTYAMPLSIWGLWFCLRGRWAAGYGLFGAALLFQFLVGVLPALMLMPVMCLLVVKDRRWTQGAAAIGLLALLGGAVVIPMWLGGATSTGLLNNEAFVHLFAHIRHPHHHVPSAWPKHEYVHFGSFVAAALVGLWQSRTIPRRIKTVLCGFIAATLAAIAANFVFVEVVPWAVVAKLQFARATPFVMILVLAVVSALAAQRCRERQWLFAAAILMTLFVEYGGLPLLVFMMLLQVRETRDMAWAGRLQSVLRARFVVPVFAVATCAFAIRQQSVIWPFPSLLLRCAPLLIVMAAAGAVTMVAAPTVRRIAAWTMATGIVVVVATGLTDRLPPIWNDRFAGHFDIDAAPRDDRSILAHRLRQSTPRDALILVNPSAYDFKIASRRATVVDWMAPFSDTGLIEWRRRLEDVVGRPLRPGMCSPRTLDGLYEARDAEQLSQVAATYGARYFLARRHGPPAGWEVHDREGQWVVYVQKKGRSDGATKGAKQ